ncbi:MAG: DUF3800 domain-containing protein [Terracidiphilus sp.]|jgi:hypothetical protein
MFTIYIDDSGTGDNQTVAIASGLIVPTSRIKDLDSEWALLLKREKFGDFHAAQCAYGSYKTEYVGWKTKKVNRVFHCVRHIAKKYGAHAYSFAIRKEEYDEFVTEELRETGGERHFTWAIRHLITAIDKSTDELSVLAPVEFVFDWMDEGSPGRREIGIVMEQADSIRPGRYKGHYSFRHRQELPGLQCVDLLAWACYRYAVFAYDSTPLTELAEKSFWDFENFNDGKWMYAVVQKKEDLERWVKAELADPRSQERRRQWLANHST